MGNQLNWPLEYLYGGKIDGFAHTDGLDFVSMDFEFGLELNPLIADADRGKRYVAFFRHANREGYIVIVDDVKWDDANRTYEFLLHPDDQHTIVKEGPGQFAFNGNVDLKIRMIEPADPLHTIATNDPGDPRYWPYLRLRSQNDRSRGLFLTVLYPLDSGQTMPTITDIREGSIIGAQVGEDLILFNTDPASGPINTAGVITDGDLVALRIESGVVQNAVVRNGTVLVVNGQVIPFEDPADGPKP